MNACIYPGSFDPLTNGHMDIIKRANRIFPKVFVGVLHNTAKRCLYSTEQRVEMIRRATASMDGVEAVAFDGLLIELMEQLSCRVIIRGLRTAADLELEKQLFAVNRQLDPKIETLALFTNTEVSFISSSTVRELIEFQADISAYVPKEVVDMINGGRRK